MRLNYSTIAAVALLSVAAPTAARRTDQFQKFFPAWNGYLLRIIDNECPEQRDAYLDPPDDPDAFVPAFQLAKCILNEMDEFRKIEMGVTTLLLGLLPTMLKQGGPSFAEISVLATRRPLLASLLGIAMPSVSMGGPMTDPAESLRRSIDFHVRSGFLARPEWPWLLISIAEYLIAGAAVANVFWPIYQLAYWSVSVSAIAVYSGPMSETYPPFLWIMLVVPVHLGFLSLKLQYRASKPDGDSEKLRDSSWKTRLGFIRREFTPCAKGDPLLLTKTNKRFLSILVHYLACMASITTFVFGSVALSSQIFISLADVIAVIARFMVSNIVCRIVLSFELHGIREVTSQSLEEDAIIPSHVRHPREYIGMLGRTGRLNSRVRNCCMSSGLRSR